MITINYETYFSNRQVDFLPKHFLVSKTPVTKESLSWIYEKLHGRFYLKNASTNIFDFERYPCFENPAEMSMYEIAWS
jgi:hypothetical protein